MHVCMRAYHTRVHPHHARRLSSHLCFYVPAIRICFNGHVRVHTKVVGLKIPATPGGVTISTSTATKSSCVAVCMPRLFARAKSYGNGLRLVSRAAFEACLPKSVSPLHGDIMHPMDSGQGSRRPVSVAFVPKGNTRDGVHEKKSRPVQELALFWFASCAFPSDAGMANVCIHRSDTCDPRNRTEMRHESESFSSSSSPMCILFLTISIS